MITRLTADKTGFPLAVVQGVGDFHLWPVTKFQFEQFLAETGRYNQKHYEKILVLNKKIPYDSVSEENYEQLFVTGILPEEAAAFADYLGEGFRLPTEEEWKTFYRAVEKKLSFRLSPYGLSKAAETMGKKIGEFRRSPLEFSFLRGGVAEWLKNEKEGRYVGRGAPRSSFFPNVWNPLEETIQVIDKKERIYYFGFRLIRGNGGRTL